MSLARHLSKGLRNGLFTKSNFWLFGGPVTRCSSIWEPDYLILAKTKTPEYDLINIQIQGYDFAVLEQYQNLIRKIARYMKIDVVKSWPAPQQDLEIHHYKQNSTDIEYKYNLKLSERNVQVVDVKSHIMPLFIETVLTTCPPGVKLSVHEHEDQMEENRYVPNMGIVELQEALDSIGTDKKKVKKLASFLYRRRIT